jgi:hypothetical protein
MQAQDFDISNFVPSSILADIRRMVDKLKDEGAKHILLQIPMEDYANTLMAVSHYVFGPFTPMLYGCPVAGWDGDHVGVMAQMAPTEKKPVIVDATGAVHEVR